VGHGHGLGASTSGVKGEAVGAQKMWEALVVPRYGAKEKPIFFFATNKKKKKWCDGFFFFKHKIFGCVFLLNLKRAKGTNKNFG
jgi:hypothetical protein